MFLFLSCFSMVSFSNRPTIDSLLLEYHNSGNDSVRLGLLDGITQYWADKNSDSCIFFGKKLIDGAIKSGDTILIYNAYFTVFDQFMSKGMYDSSLIYSFQSMGFVRGVNRFRDKFAVLLATIGDQYRATGQYRIAINYLLESLEVAKSIDNLSFKSFIPNRISAVYLETHKYDTALRWANSSLKLAYLANDSTLVFSNLNIIGSIYRDKGQWAESVETYRNALSYAKKINDSVKLANIYNNMAITYFRIQVYDSTIKYAKKSYGFSSTANIKALTVISSEYLSQVYSRTGKFELAFKYLKVYERTRQYLLNRGLYNQIFELNTKYESQKKEQQIERQKMQIEKKNFELREKNITITVFLFGFFFLSTFSIYVYRTHKKLSRTNRLLNSKNVLISKQKTKIETYSEKIDLAYGKLRKLDKHKQAMTSMLVHDLKNPLNLLINLDELNVTDGKDEIVNRTGKQMLNLIMNLLDINKAEENNFSLEKSKVDLYGILDASFKETTFLCKQRNIKITSKAAYNYTFTADMEIMVRVFTNLLTNAIKFSPLNSSIELSTTSVSDKVFRISVKDKGPGIATEYHETIFEKFKQAKKIKSGNIGSTGLGLAFCKLAVEAHGWSIGVESRPEKGATFWIDIFGHKTNRDDPVKQAIDDRKKETAIESDFKIEDKQILLPYFLELEKLEVYQISEIRRILAAIRKMGFSDTKSWLKQIQMAAMALNENNYNSLVKEIIGKLLNHGR